MRKCLRKFLRALRCEEHFKATHSRIPKRRYIVRLPFKNGSFISIGKYFIAVSSFRRLEQCSINASEYREFLAWNTRSYDQKSTDRNCQTRANLLYSASRCLMWQQCNHPLTSGLHAAYQTSLNDHMLIDPKLTEGFSYCPNALAPILLRVYRRYRQNVSINLNWLFRPTSRPTSLDYQRTVCVTYFWWTNHGLPPSYHYLRYSCHSLFSLSGLRTIRRRWRCRIRLRFSFYVIRHIMMIALLAQTPRFLQTCDQLIELLKKGDFCLWKWATNATALLSELNGLAT